MNGMVEDVNRVALAVLIKSLGPGLIQRGGSPDRRVVGLREVLANLACKLRCLLVHVRSWLSSWPSGCVATGCDVVLLCQSWWHYSLDGGSLAVLCNTVSVMVFIIVSWFLGASYLK